MTITVRAIGLIDVDIQVGVYNAGVDHLHGLIAFETVGISIGQF
jgi:hypothetical protein